jgi:hypothetical protein
MWLEAWLELDMGFLTDGGLVALLLLWGMGECTAVLEAGEEKGAFPCCCCCCWRLFVEVVGTEALGS